MAMGMPIMKDPYMNKLDKEGGGGKVPSVSEVDPPSLKHQADPPLNKKVSEKDNFNLNSVDIAEQERLYAEILKRQEAQNQETILDHKGRKVQQKVTFPKDIKSVYNQPRRHSIIQNKIQSYNNNYDQNNGSRIMQESKEVEERKRDISEISTAYANIQNDSNLQKTGYFGSKQMDMQSANIQNIQFLQWNDDNMSSYQSDFQEQQNQRFQLNVNVDDSELSK